MWEILDIPNFEILRDLREQKSSRVILTRIPKSRDWTYIIESIPEILLDREERVVQKIINFIEHIIQDILLGGSKICSRKELT